LHTPSCYQAALGNKRGSLICQKYTFRHTGSKTDRIHRQHIFKVISTKTATKELLLYKTFIILPADGFGNGLEKYQGNKLMAIKLGYYSENIITQKHFILLSLLFLFFIISCVKDTPLNNGPGYNTGMIAYTAYADSLASDTEIFLVNIYDYTPESINISNNIANDCYPYWLYDKSAFIYISSGSIGSALYKADPVSLENYVFHSSNDSIHKIITSPAEPKLIYFKSIPNNDEINVSVLNIDTGVSSQLSNISRSGNYHAAWSVDGQKVAVKAGVVHVYDNEGHLLYYIQNIVGDYYEWDETGKGLYSIHAGNLLYSDTLKIDTLISGMNLTFPAISPNRRYLACVAQSELIVIDIGFRDYQTVKQITLPQPLVFGDRRIVDWSPDSREISFIDYQGSHYNIFTASQSSFYPVEQVTDDAVVPKSLCQ